MNILFVCKYNKFRSQVAESYFNKINKNKKIKTFSGGIFPGRYPLDKLQSSIAKSMGIIINKRPKPIPTTLLRKMDLIIDVADNVPKSLFKFKKEYCGKTIAWNIPDEQEGRKDKIKNIINMIKVKVENLIKELN